MVRAEDRCLLTDHLNKVDQSDYRKITIHSKKVVVGQSTAGKKKNKKTTTTTKTIGYWKQKVQLLIANVFQEIKVFQQTMFFFWKHYTYNT